MNPRKRFYSTRASRVEGEVLEVPQFIPYVYKSMRGHGGRVVTLSPPTSEAGVRSPSRPYVGKLVVACRWSAVYSAEP